MPTTVGQLRKALDDIAEDRPILVALGAGVDGRLLLSPVKTQIHEDAGQVAGVKDVILFPDGLTPAFQIIFGDAPTDSSE